MTREQYIILLRAELAGRMPEGELEDILRYYNEYIEEAGPDHERDVLIELGSPERLAKKILGEAPTAGAPDPGVNFSYDCQPQGPACAPFQYNGTVPPWVFIVIAVCVGCFAAPAVVGLAFGLGIGGVACIVAGVGVAISGSGVGDVASILYMAGGGVMAIAVGMLLVFLCTRLIRGAVRLCRKLWNRYVSGVEREGDYEQA